MSRGKSNSRLVFSTDQGRIKEAKNQTQTIHQGAADGCVRIRLETKGRKGKGVTLIEGVPGDDASLKSLAKSLKQLCGSGGSVKSGIIELQGDCRAVVKHYFEEQGTQVK